MCINSLLQTNNAKVISFIAIMQIKMKINLFCKINVRNFGASSLP